jgi:hypothetical protein
MDSYDARICEAAIVRMTTPGGRILWLATKNFLVPPQTFAGVLSEDITRCQAWFSRAESRDVAHDEVTEHIGDLVDGATQLLVVNDIAFVLLVVANTHIALPLCREADIKAML